MKENLMGQKVRGLHAQNHQNFTLNPKPYTLINSKIPNPKPLNQTPAGEPRDPDLDRG